MLAERVDVDFRFVFAVFSVFERMASSIFRLTRSSLFPCNSIRIAEWRTIHSAFFKISSQLNPARCYNSSAPHKKSTPQKPLLPFEVETNVEKDRVLFVSEKPGFFRILNLFGVCQFLLWAFSGYLIISQYQRIKPKPGQPEDSVPQFWWQQGLFRDYSKGVGIAVMGIGYLILYGIWMYTLHSVRYLILMKGGKQLCFVVYTPYGKDRHLTVPINKVSSTISRSEVKAFLPVKIKGHIFHYLLDKSGSYPNPQLFDQSAGLQRKL